MEPLEGGRRCRGRCVTTRKGMRFLDDDRREISGGEGDPYR